MDTVALIGLVIGLVVDCAGIITFLWVICSKTKPYRFALAMALIALATALSSIM